MIDTGQSHMQKEVLKIAGDHNIKRIFLTHHHEDHSGNAAAIKLGYDTTVFGHPLTKEKMKVSFHILSYQKYVWGKSAPLKIELVPKKIETALGEMVPVHTPGHSKDHTAFFLKDEGVLFSGDLYLADKIKFFRFLEELYGNIIMFWEKGYSEKQIFSALKLKEDYFIKYFCFGNVSMINGVKSVVRHYETKKG